ncbi:MAG: MFS transporter [Candidatus Humimicrobiaceae bacterium]|jgi:FSR family fosmidomycin resistance protein-like MFS transporter|nr:MFS transporter [Actinomycetota bacterium]MDY0027701.1 MFS transporter [Candidatus Humimicrobiaceae bacterium]
MNKENIQFNKLQILLSSSSHFITDIYQSFIIGLIPILALKFNLSLFKVGLLTATGTIANSLFSPIFGYFSDRHGLKYYLIAGPLFTSIFLSLIGIIPNYYLLLLFLFLGNLSIAAYHPASAAIAGHFGGDKKGLGSSIINFGGNLGYSIGSLLIILVTEKLNIYFTPIAIIPGLIVVIFLFKFAPDIKSNNEQVYSIDSLRIKKSNKEKIYILLLIMFAEYSLYILWITLLTYMPLYFTGLNVTLINIGVILFLFGMLGGAGGLLTGFIFDRFKKGFIIIQIAFALSIPLFFFTFKTTGLTSIILFILGGFFLISIQPVCIRMAQDIMPENMSLASSLILGFSPGIAAITMIFLGKAADIIGIEALVNYELILILFTIILLFFKLPSAEGNLKK